MYIETIKIPLKANNLNLKSRSFLIFSKKKNSIIKSAQGHFDI
jgi:hypothetical protein